MICPITDKPCRTNGCGEKCYKRDSLGYSTAPQHDSKLPVSKSVCDSEHHAFRLKWVGICYSCGQKEEDVKQTVC